MLLLLAINPLWRMEMGVVIDSLIDWLIEDIPRV